MLNIKRIFDVFAALFGLIFLLPIFIIISVWILFDSDGGVFYKQNRVGLYQSNFQLVKFRTMKIGADSGGLLTIGNHDERVTKIGYWLRKYKLDELPQLWNIFIGDMSFVGPRPEVSKYVALYTKEQKQVLNVKPGLTDWASLKYIDEDQILGNCENPEEYYIREMIPNKINENLKYIANHNTWIDLKIIFITIKNLIHK